jgi:hypothetical protein
MKHALTFAALLAGLVLAAPVLRAADESPATPMPNMPADAKGLGSDTLVVIVSDTAFGPDSADARDAARYYCANRGKLSVLVGKERPLEFRSQVLQQWSLLTYRCVTAGQTAN